MTLLRCALLPVLMLASAFASSPTRAAGFESISVAHATEDWAEALATYVDDEGYVDFRALAAAPERLQRFVDWLAVVDPRSHPSLFDSPADVLAYHLNAYNALAMRQVLALNQPKKLSLLKRLRFFRRAEVVVGGQSINLEDYENDIIRTLGESRIHVALNCMSEGCPRLPREPFYAARLEAQLERESHKFFSEPRNVRIDHNKQQVFLTAIMKFFTEDFLAAEPSLIAYANRYRSADQQIPAHYKVRFLRYDWTVIQQR